MVPPSLIDDVVRQTARQELRRRLLSAQAVVYDVLAMVLYNRAGYEEVSRYVVEGPSWLPQWRIKTPDGVVQHVYGCLLTNFAIRGLMHDAGLEADEDPDRRSFLQTLHIVR